MSNIPPLEDQGISSLFTPTFTSFLDHFDSSIADDKKIDPTSTEYIMAKTGVIESIENFFFSHLNKINFQIIQGDYIDINFTQQIERLISDIDKVKGALDPYEIQFSEIDPQYDQILQELSACSDSFYVLKQLCNTISTRSKSITYTISTRSNRPFDNVFSLAKPVFKSIEIFIYNVYLIKVDHYLNIDNPDYSIRIDHLKKRLSKLEITNLPNNYGKLLKIISAKASFLKKKIILRRLEELNEAPEKVFIHANNSYDKFSVNSIIGSASTSKFKIWLEYLLNHYELEKSWRFDIEEKFNEIEFDFNKEIKFVELHRYIKYYKDVSELSPLDKYSKLKEVKKYIQKKLTKSNDKYEQHVFSTCLIYCYNNILSLLEANNLVDQLLNEYNQLIEEPKLEGFNNYFATGQLLRHYANELRVAFTNGDITENIKLCYDILLKCNELLIKFENEIEWFKQNNNYIFLLPKSESAIEVEGYQLFIFSNFCLPLSNKYLRDKFEDAVSQVKLYKTTFEGVKSLQQTLNKVNEVNKEFKEINKEFDKVKDSIAQKESKTLEMVALIGALLGFITGSIPGFSFIDSGIEAIWFTIALGSSLSFFAFVLFIINRGIDFMKKRWWLLCVYFAVVGLSWGSLLMTTKDYNSMRFNKTQIKEYMDSINDNNSTRVDSLIETKLPLDTFSKKDPNTKKRMN